MVVKSNLYGVLLYNQQKVDKGSGTVLATHIIREPEDGNFNAAGVAGEFARFRCEQPVLHISINPNPKDGLDDGRMAEIAEQCMDRMGWGGQPYIVFRYFIFYFSIAASFSIALLSIHPIPAWGCCGFSCRKKCGIN